MNTYPTLHLQRLAAGAKIPRAALTELRRDGYITTTSDGEHHLTTKATAHLYRKDN